MNVSVILATHRRARMLRATLASVAASDFSRDRFEVVVCDNAADPDTKAVCDEFGKEFALRYLVEETRGKNAALNHAVEHAQGDLFLFTDDDVIADESWICETWQGAERWPEHLVFGGRVLPIWPGPVPAHLSNHSLHGVFFTLLDPDLSEGPTEGFLPFGPNMAVRRSVFDAGHRYDVRVGPLGRSYVMGSETDFVRRLQRDGHTPVFLPGSSVGHTVRPDQFSVRWLLRRSVNYGRMLAHRETEGAGAVRSGRRFGLLGSMTGDVVRLGWHAVRGARADAFDHASHLAVSIGRLHQRIRRTASGTVLHGKSNRPDSSRPE